MNFQHKYRLLVMEALKYVILFYPKYNIYHAFKHTKSLDKEIKLRGSQLGMVIADIHYGTLEPLIGSAISFYPNSKHYDNQYLEPSKSINYAKKIFKSNKADNDDVIKIDANNDVTWDDFNLIGSITVDCEYITRPPYDKPKNDGKNTYIFV